MSKPPPIKRLTDAQAAGANPADNAWMSASAGTGKTQVLSARIMRLLLEGVKPQSILAITFTKAGAAEMAWRIREKLAAWVQMKDSDLRLALHEIHAPDHLDADRLAFARTLFATVIDAPGGGLAIQTIHSFCQSLLASFPEEAGLSPGFRPIEDREIAELQRDVLSDLIVNARARGDLGFLDRLQTMALDLGEGPTQAYLYHCAAAHEALGNLPAGVGPWLRKQFGLDSDIAPEEWLERSCADEEVDIQGLRAIAAANEEWGTKTGLERTEVLRAWIESTLSVRAVGIDALLQTIATKDGEVRKDYLSGRLDAVGELAAQLVEAIEIKRDKATQMRTCDRLAGALEAGRYYARAYVDRKRRDGLVDFDDLIDQTVKLLKSGGQEWIRYKLDMRIDHILVDEAQDTNHRQWEIVDCLTDEFYAGSGAKGEALRTLFVVGDTKQAIFGFQGTNPIFFEQARERFKRRGQDANRPFNDIAIDMNYRSSPPILKLVDALIEQVGPQQFGLEANSVNHMSNVIHAPGRVTLWPLEPYANASGTEENEHEDVDEEGWIDSGTRRIAGKIGQTVRHWLDHGIDGSPVKPSDIMILVRRRSDIAALMVSRLIANGVPVAGVDRLKLQSPIAVQDLLAAMRFSLQPHDDLNLAALLTSPLIGWTHQELIDHGWRMDADGKFPISLWRHLNRQPALEQKLAPLHDLMRMAGYESPHRFLEIILSGPMQGRARLLARLGNAALDPIEELVSQALAFETRVGASLHYFLAWFDAGTGDIKREFEGGEDAVRVMTVHGAKGLQARIVILADAAGNPTGNRDKLIQWSSEHGELPLLGTKKDDLPTTLRETVDAKAAEAMKEHMRLLYVAATRAERMLFVAGAMPYSKDPEKVTLPEGNWYSALESAALAIGGQSSDTEPMWGGALTYAVAGIKNAHAETEAVARLGEIDIPSWARARAPEDPRPPRPLTPSTQQELDDLSVPQHIGASSRDAAMVRGTLIHALFERLPDSAPERRREAAMRWLAARAPDASESTCDGMIASVLGVLDDPAFADLFGPNSLAEAPFSALVDGRVIAGTVDRLLVTDSDVRIIDYKSGRFVPASAAEVPVGYLRQMAAYVAALQVIFPNHLVSAALLFSEGPRLITLPDILIELYKPKLVVV